MKHLLLHHVVMIDNIIIYRKLKESDIEKLEADQFSIFRKCKLEEIYLPLERGSLDDIPIKDSVWFDFDLFSIIDSLFNKFR